MKLATDFGARSATIIFLYDICTILAVIPAVEWLAKLAFFGPHCTAMIVM